jgi:hypothetical protein
MSEKGKALRGALAEEPRSKPQRVSPGVYRSASGQLVTQQGKALPRPQGYGNRGPAQNNNMASVIGAATGNMQSGYYAARPGQQMPNLGPQPGMSFQDAIAAAKQQQQADEAAVQLARQAGMMRNMDPLYMQPEQNMGNMMDRMMPQPSANNGGKYRLSPGVYGTREQAMQQMNIQPAYTPAGRRR